MSDLLQVLPTSEPRTVRLIGELDASNAEEFLGNLLPQIQGGGDLVLNLAELSFVDSMGLRSLLRLARVLENTGKLLLDSPQRAVARTIELVGLEQAPNIAVVGGPPAES
ncbi:MAG TPA: STAS domain-containing protein [Actinomycetota bacterium]|nr:STAS domain-containing protein [Actinomycetota bacterium]